MPHDHMPKRQLQHEFSIQLKKEKSVSLGMLVSKSLRGI